MKLKYKILIVVFVNIYTLITIFYLGLVVFEHQTWGSLAMILFCVILNVGTNGYFLYQLIEYLYDRYEGKFPFWLLKNNGYIYIKMKEMKRLILLLFLVIIMSSCGVEYKVTTGYYPYDYYPYYQYRYVPTYYPYYGFGQVIPFRTHTPHYNQSHNFHHNGRH